MPTYRTFELARSKPKYIRVPSVIGGTQKEYYIEIKITHEEWVAFVDNCDKLIWSPVSPERRKVAYLNSKTINGYSTDDCQITEGNTGEIDFILWKKNKENVEFVYKMAEHFNGKLYKHNKEYVLK